MRRKLAGGCVLRRTEVGNLQACLAQALQNVVDHRRVAPFFQFRARIAEAALLRFAIKNAADCQEFHEYRYVFRESKH